MLEQDETIEYPLCDPDSITLRDEEAGECKEIFNSHAVIETLKS